MLHACFCKFYPKREIIVGVLLISAVIDLILFFRPPFESVLVLTLLNGFVQAPLWPMLLMILGEPLDMLMYYDARVEANMNGLFDRLSLEPSKTYYPYLAFHQMSESGEEILSEGDTNEIYSLAVSDGKETQLLLTYFAEDDDSPAADLTLQFRAARKSEVSVCLSDQNRNMELVKTVTVEQGEQTLELPLNLFDIYHIVIAPIDRG